MQNLKLKAYRVFNRVVPCDITQILLLSLQDSLPPGREPGHAEGSKQAGSYTFRFFDPEDIKLFSRTPESELKADMVELLESQQAMCFGIEKDGELAGYAWAATGNVDAKHNCGGGRFRGIGLRLPQHMTYLFKVYVMPSHRGNNLNPWMLYRLGQALKTRGYLHIISTTDWTNYAFQRSVEKLGFKRLTLEGEFLFGSTHRYWLPDLSAHGVSLVGGASS